jgi:hypothetical protein
MAPQANTSAITAKARGRGIESRSQESGSQESRDKKSRFKRQEVKIQETRSQDSRLENQEVRAGRNTVPHHPSLRGTKQSRTYRGAMQLPPVQFAIACRFTSPHHPSLRGTKQSPTYREAMQVPLYSSRLLIARHEAIPDLQRGSASTPVQFAIACRFASPNHPLLQGTKQSPTYRGAMQVLPVQFAIAFPKQIRDRQCLAMT